MRKLKLLLPIGLAVALLLVTLAACTPKAAPPGVPMQAAATPVPGMDNAWAIDGPSGTRLASLSYEGNLGVLNDLAVGGDVAIAGSLTGALTTTGEIVFGANSLYAVGASLPGVQIGGFRTEITGTHVYTHATGVPLVVTCAMETPTEDATLCGIERGSTAVTVTVYSSPPTLTVSAVAAWVNVAITGLLP